MGAGRGTVLVPDHGPVPSAGGGGHIGPVLVPVFHFQSLRIIGLAQNPDPALFTLDDGLAGAVRILGPGQNGLEAGIGQNGRARGVHSVKAQIGEVAGLFRFPVEGRRHINVIEIDIIKGSARKSRVEGRGRISLQIVPVAAGILGKVALVDLQGPDPGQHLLKLFENRSVDGGNGFQDKKVFFPGQTDQIPGLSGRGSEGLFQDDVLSGFQSLSGIAVVDAVDKTDIDRVDIRFRKELTVIRIDGSDPVPGRHVHSLLPAVGTAEDGRHLDLLHVTCREQCLRNDLSGSYNCKLHCFPPSCRSPASGSRHAAAAAPVFEYNIGRKGIQLPDPSVFSPPSGPRPPLEHIIKSL